MKTIREVFSDNLIRLRGNRSQAAIAEKAGISTGGYQKAEHGTIPQEKTLAAIAKALGVDETELFQDPDLATIPNADELSRLLKIALKSEIFQKNAAAALIAAIRGDIEQPR